MLEASESGAVIISGFQVLSSCHTCDLLSLFTVYVQSLGWDGISRASLTVTEARSRKETESGLDGMGWGRLLGFQ